MLQRIVPSHPALVNHEAGDWTSEELSKGRARDAEPRAPRAAVPTPPR